jgi:Leucine-rich repeat (LRR) protein
MPEWVQPLQTLSGIPGVQLRVEWVGSIERADHPFIAQWLKQHGKRISNLAVEINVSNDRLKLREFAEAAEPCRSIDLSINHPANHLVDLHDLDPVALSLQVITCACAWGHGVLGLGVLRNASALTRMSQLTALHLAYEELELEGPWGLLAKLTQLQRLTLSTCAAGDPSTLSALTGLASLHLESVRRGPAPFSFSSLQPLRTLEQLEELHIMGHACSATSLQGLAGLSNLNTLAVEADFAGLMSLEGISPTVRHCSLWDAPDLVSLAGIEDCTSMVSLALTHCGVSSLQPLRGLSSMKQLTVENSCISSLEGLDSMSLLHLTLIDCSFLTQLSGVEHLSALMSLEVSRCGGVTSLQPLSQLGEGLRSLRLCGCERVEEEVLKLPHVEPTAIVVVDRCSVREVVLAGGVRWAPGAPA